MSVGICGSKYYQNTDSNIKAMMYAKETDVASTKGGKIAVKDLGGIIPNVHRLTSPLVDVAYNIQATYVNINLQRVETKYSGLWQSKVYIYASTDK